jgi:hypothetical protein
VTWARALVGVALLYALLMGITMTRELGAGAYALTDSDNAVARGDYATATMRARDAAEAVTQASPYPGEGYRRLEAIARAAEARSDERTAVAAWGAMRSAATATSSPLRSTDAWRALADDGLVRAGSHAGPDSAEAHASEAILRAALAHEDAPSTGLLALLGFGALAFFAGCGRLAFAARSFAALWQEKRALAAVVVGGVLYAMACFRA